MANFLKTNTVNWESVSLAYYNNEGKNVLICHARKLDNRLLWTSTENRK